MAIKAKKKKNDLHPDRVVSKNFHVGIELELLAPGEGSGEHDDDACASSYAENFHSAREVLRDYFSLTADEARALEPYFNFSEWVDDYMRDWSCDDSECPYISRDENGTRDSLECELRELTENESFKVVSDSSIRTDSETVGAEVCWNYFASKETIKDNARILKFLTDNGCSFNKSCGLHINLNNYLGVPQVKIEKEKFDFLFDFVGASRRENSFCNSYGMSANQKYSMIYHQDDRLEFRFFSPTLDAEKLNHYVTLAHTVYKRLAGIDAKLPRKSMSYFLKKMTEVNELSAERAWDSLKKVNSIKSVKVTETQIALELGEAAV
jgi:hypothetical protein